MRKIEVFFYGLFMDEQLLRAKGVTPTYLRPASVSGFQLRIGTRATLVPTEIGRVFGLVASLSHAELELLYSEPTVQSYRPEAVIANLSNGEPRAVLCVNLIEPPSPDEHNPEYASKLRSLAQQLQFPSEYVDSIV